jgi:uncharacterized protein (DUF58 family)
LINYKKAREFGTLELLAKQVVEGFITGLHKSPFHGFSVEFAEHRLYNTGESTKHIDWKLFARSEKLFIKRYEEETNLRCQIVVDSSSSMQFPANKPYNKLSFSIDAAASLVYLMRKQRDAVGVTVFNDEIEIHTKPKSSITNQRFILAQLENHLKNIYKEKQKKGTDVSAVIKRLAETTHKRSLIIIFSDFLGVDNIEELMNSFKHLRHYKHEILVFDVSHFTLEDQLDLKNSFYTFVDMETGEKIKLQPSQLKERYLESKSAHREKLKTSLLQQKIEYVFADIERGFDQVLLEYLIKRKKII